MEAADKGRQQIIRIERRLDNSHIQQWAKEF